jgi:hypothetical protein
MNTDGNTDAINRHLYELEQYQMQDEIDTLHDEVDRLEGQRDELLGALKTIADGPWPDAINTQYAQCVFDEQIARAAIAACEADQ